MALSADLNLNRRGSAKSSNEYGYSVAPGEIVYRGSLIALNAAGYIQRIQTAGSIVFLGVCDRNLDNRTGATPMPYAIGQKGTWVLPVPGAVFANINAPVYATDDSTLTLASNGGSNMLVGTLTGLDAGLTCVSILGS